MMVWDLEINFLLKKFLNGSIRKVIMLKFEVNFFAQKVSKWSNSKSYHVKSEIWRPSNFFYYQAILARQKISIFVQGGKALKFQDI